mmetsp:Transcript_21865/g.41722  ORF Transcript_21865/g.41722 Transcript_21865/m.41722 type:complete len:194 (+) Transcript_21865:218-799(+)
MWTGLSPLGKDVQGLALAPRNSLSSMMEPLGAAHWCCRTWQWASRIHFVASAFAVLWQLATLAARALRHALFCSSSLEDRGGQRVAAGHIHQQASIPHWWSQLEMAKKPEHVRSIVNWLRDEAKEQIEDKDVYFFDDYIPNIEAFQNSGFNARLISCSSRDHMSLGDSGHSVGLCGAMAEEVVRTPGVYMCGS